MVSEPAPPARRWRLTASGAWQSAVMARGESLLATADDVHAVCFTFAVCRVLDQRNSPGIAPHLREQSFIVARRTLARSMGLSDDTTVEFLLGSRQIGRAAFTKAMSAETPFGPPICVLSHYLLLCASIDAVRPDGIGTFLMNGNAPAPPPATKTNREYAHAYREVVRLTKTLAAAQTAGRPRQPDEPDWHRVLKLVDRPPSTSLRAQIRRLLAEHGVLTNAEIRMHLAAEGYPATADDVTKRLWELVKSNLVHTEDVGVHYAAEWPPKKPNPKDLES